MKTSLTQTLALASFSLLAAACGPADAPAGQGETLTSAQAPLSGPSERWCRSYTSEKLCPSVCAWYSTPAPGYCGLPATE